MTDDTRQARIAAAMMALFHGERGDVALGYYTVRSRMDAALDAADAIGRERVSERELQEAIGALSQAAFDHGVERGLAEYRDPGDRLKEAAAKNKQAWDRVRALLTAAPAERGDE